jgi:iron complex outermembrane receptor protein
LAGVTSGVPDGRKLGDNAMDTRKALISALLMSAATVAIMSNPVYAQSSETAASTGTGTETVIVTGTRRSGVTVADSPAPIQVVDDSALEHVGQTNLSQALNQLLPSVTTQAFGGDANNFTLSAALRGLNPNQTLVLINGKRRHGTANLQIGQSPFQGSAAPDLDLIAPTAIDHIEVLQDGAAAQYGSDAIAGVVNIILKSDNSGGTAFVTGGQLYHGDGEELSESGRLALPIGDKGYLDLSVLHRFHGFNYLNGADNRVSLPDGTLLPGVPQSWANLPGFPFRLNKKGQPLSDLTTGMFNAGYDFGDVQVYSFGNYSIRTGVSNETWRTPSAISRTVGGVTTLFAPNGFLPQLHLHEVDYSITGGAKGQIGGWNWDLSGTYGRDRHDIHNFNSANSSLYIDTGFTPTDFYIGDFIAAQTTANLDLKRDINVGLGEPLTLAIGGEFKRDEYQIGQGDAGSIYKTGVQAYPGLAPVDAGSHYRSAWSGYADVAFNPVKDLSIDLAGRYENYSDFGNEVIGKLTARYDFSPAFAVRGTISNGFRAPTLAESYYSKTGASPISVTVSLPADSASASILGFKPLTPEKSINYSLGTVTHLLDGLTATLDAYEITIQDRIAQTGNVLGQSGSTVINPAVLAAVAAHGTVPDPTVTFVTASSFANGVDTRTRGIDLSVNYSTTFDFGHIDWSLTGNFNRTTITRNKLGPTLFNDSAEAYLSSASPEYKVGLGAVLTADPFTVNLRETIYGQSKALGSPSGAAPFYPEVIPVTALTDLEVSYALLQSVQLSVGANNLFNEVPPTVGPVPGSVATATSGPALLNGANIYGIPYFFGPYGAFGGFYYARVTVNF